MVESDDTDRVHVEKRYIHQDGHTIWVSIHGTLVRDADGQPLHTVAHVQDITLRHAANRDLEESEAQLRRIVDALADDGIVVNRKKVQRLMRIMGLAALYPKPRTTIPAVGHRIYPYLLRRLRID